MFEALDLLPLPVFAIRKDGTIRWLNLAAEREAQARPQEEDDNSGAAAGEKAAANSPQSRFLERHRAAACVR